MATERDKRLKLLITGKRNKLWRAVGAAFSRQRGLRADVIPMGAPAIETVRRSSLDAVLYTISDEEEIDLLRWILQINPALPVIALLPAANPGMRKQLLDEGAARVVVISSYEPARIRKNIVGPVLEQLGLRSTTSEAGKQISNDLHSIRSVLTAILGSAELALKRSLPSAVARKQIKEIPRGVMEIENILRRLDRTLQTRRPGPKRNH